MNREQMVEEAWRSITAHNLDAWAAAEEIVDLLLPQVTTVAELEALPLTSKMLADDGSIWAKPLPIYGDKWFGLAPFGSLAAVPLTSRELFQRKESLTVVWQPEENHR